MSGRRGFMMPKAALFLEKSRECLVKAQEMLDTNHWAGHGN